MMDTIGFLGCGNMGGAIARAVCKAVDPKKVFLANRTAAKAQALADLFTSIAEQADHAAKIMPPSAVEAVYAMCHGCPPTTNFMRSISEMLRISLPEFEKLEYSISDGCGCTAGCGSWMVLHFKNGYSSLHIQISGYSRIEILSQAVQSANAVRYTENYKACEMCRQ